jgi:hypothetical protein
MSVVNWPPKCQCDCHKMPGVRHVAPCCDDPPFDGESPFSKAIKEYEREHVIPEERRAPVQASIFRRDKGPGTIAWSEHVEAHAAFVAQHGILQSAECIADRGGFTYYELTVYLGREPSTWEACP